jgi:hypothetical protein
VGAIDVFIRGLMSLEAVVIVGAVVTAGAVVVVGAVVAVGVVVVVETIVTLALIGRLSKALRMAVGHLSRRISQARRRSAIGLDAGPVCVRARRKKKVVVKWMNFMVVVGKN